MSPASHMFRDNYAEGRGQRSGAVTLHVQKNTSQLVSVVLSLLARAAALQPALNKPILDKAKLPN
jgi:uncharacterized membrane protein